MLHRMVKLTGNSFLWKGENCFAFLTHIPSCSSASLMLHQPWSLLALLLSKFHLLTWQKLVLLKQVNPVKLDRSQSYSAKGRGTGRRHVHTPESGEEKTGPSLNSTEKSLDWLSCRRRLILSLLQHCYPTRQVKHRERETSIEITI